MAIIKDFKLFENDNNKTQNFIRKAIEIHGDKYDYSDVDYQSTKKKVKIICPIHGAFYQYPEKHIYQKSGCPYCANNIKYSTDEWIKRAKMSHGNKYDYSDVNYINNNTKVKIICPLHGPFFQRPNNHLAGDGCPVCQESKGEHKIKKYLVENNIKFEYQKKFQNW